MPTHIYPVARYIDARGAIDFFQRAFDFSVRAVYDAPDGSVAHAELTYGAGAVGLSSAGPVVPDNVWTTVREGVYACVEDADAHYARARAAGARIERPLQDTNYGSREYTARDSEGRLWSFGTYAMTDAGGPPVFVPELRYDDPEAAHRFLTSAFGLDLGLVARGAGERLSHGELWLGGSPVMISGNSHPEDWRGRAQCTHVVVDDPDGHCKRARAAGATVIRTVADTPYGARGYLAADPEGFLWGFSTYRPTR